MDEKANKQDQNRLVADPLVLWEDTVTIFCLQLFPCWSHFVCRWWFVAHLASEFRFTQRGVTMHTCTRVMHAHMSKACANTHLIHMCHEQKRWVDRVRRAASSEQQFLADLQIDAQTLDDWYTAPVPYSLQVIPLLSPTAVDFSMCWKYWLCFFCFLVLNMLHWVPSVSCSVVEWVHCSVDHNIQCA